MPSCFCYLFYKKTADFTAQQNKLIFVELFQIFGGIDFIFVHVSHLICSVLHLHCTPFQGKCQGGHAIWEAVKFGKEKAAHRAAFRYGVMA
jgi:hypothetical protein